MIDLGITGIIMILMLMMLLAAVGLIVKSSCFFTIVIDSLVQG